MDPDNPVVKLCIEGMQAESGGRPGDARELFMRAWTAAVDDYDACVAAHYVARHQDTAAATLKWNQEALTRADAVGDDRIRGFYPSLLLNVGHSHEGLGQMDEARRYYELAAARLDEVPEGPYGSVVRDGVARALERSARQPTDLRHQP